MQNASPHTHTHNNYKKSSIGQKEPDAAPRRRSNDWDRPAVKGPKSAFLKKFEEERAGAGSSDAPQQEPKGN